MTTLPPHQTTVTLPQKVRAWLKDFEQNLASNQDPTKLFDHFVQLGVDTQSSCECDNIDMKNDPGLDWLHRHHVAYNRAVHELLVRYGQLDMMKEVCRKDVEGSDQYIGDYPLPFGQCARKDYGRLLLSFLVPEPGPSWIGQ